ncbi:MAG: gamma-glutamyl-gamma-aminobutyrate hydrolase [Pelagibacterales bacterium]|nr:gamma-glutamyl-gamma-aminobutyrate hydrolase [Pelagibacterales bacterium]OUU63323.1 MAG: gamma-glutamyl-gamma-aminobutyrate hydrolase [Alphaproteobacteria bacterium TMED62]|tara:strand:+ start:6928 stop:7656 length:729 start_codon:yes stop_codon:yes gene_type:complete
MKKKPLIGLTLDLENSKSYSKFPWYAIRQNYCTTISKMGGIPLPLVYDINSINTMIEKLDGFIITGGAFDINPSYFSEKKKFSTIITKDKRTDYEIKLCNKILENNLPLLGICGGQQLINVIYGGTLIQDIDKEIETKIKHEQTNPRNQTSHKVKIIKNTYLNNIISENIIKVNSAHHQAVKNIGLGLKINAKAEDDVIEGIEDPKLNFCIGLQWHPEFLIEESDKLIYKEFISKAKKNAAR